MFISSSPHYINTVNEKTDEERGRCYLVTLPRIAFKVMGYKSCGDLFLMKSDNCQYNRVGRRVVRLIDQASDGPSIILID